MDKAEFDQFIDYYRNNCSGYYLDVIDRTYEHFGCEFIFDLLVECRPYRIEQVVRGTTWVHSTTGPAVPTIRPPGFFILGYYVTLDDWLPRSALSSEEQIMFKLKYG